MVQILNELELLLAIAYNVGRLDYQNNVGTYTNPEEFLQASQRIKPDNVMEFNSLNGRVSMHVLYT